MTSEADHEVTDDGGYPLARSTSTIVASAKDAESHSSSDLTVPPEECADVMVPLGKNADNFRSSLVRILKAIVEAFGRNAESGEYYLLTRNSRIIREEFDE
jgi:hypothetical protein